MGPVKREDSCQLWNLEARLYPPTIKILVLGPVMALEHSRPWEIIDIT
jgi:hypothetical protein